MSHQPGTGHDDSDESVASDEPTIATEIPTDRRYTAPGFDAKSTQIIHTPADPETEIFALNTDEMAVDQAAADRPPRTAPQAILPREGVPVTPPPVHRAGWKWLIVAAIALAVVALVAVVVTILLTRDSPRKVSQEELVRSTIQNFDQAIQRGDLASLRSITCGETRAGYVGYDDRAWADTHAKVAAAGQYPVVASIDQVVVNGDHAEANVTAFMAYDPATRSTRSFDLQFRDNQWEICQAG
jgi:hypothetical protein